MKQTNNTKNLTYTLLVCVAVIASNATKKAEQPRCLAFLFLLTSQIKLAMTNKNLPGLTNQQTKNLYSDFFYFTIITVILFSVWFHFSNF